MIRALINAWHSTLALLGLMLWSSSAWTMMVVPMQDETLLADSDLVVVAQVVSAAPAPGRELDETEYILSVIKSFKGTPNANPLTVRSPGALNPHAAGALVVSGLSRFEVDEHILLFLRLHEDGTYRVMQLVMGAFRYRDTDAGRPVLIRNIADDGDPDIDENVPRRRFRDAGQFEAWLIERIRGFAGNARYWSDQSSFRRGKFLLTNPKARWFEFDRNAVVDIAASADGQVGLASGGYAELVQALSAWNDDPDSNVAFQYAGTSAATGGLGSNDGVSMVLFNDPNDEIAGSFDCRKGGVGAYAQWRSLESRLYKGTLYRVIDEGDIVVQDGIGCLLDNRGDKSAQELLAHELGHLLGLDHACGDGLLSLCELGSVENDALMRPTIHADGRGASLNEDDRAGLRTIYSGPESGTVTPPQTTPPEPPAAGGGSGAGGGAFSGWLMLLIGGLLARLRARNHQPPR